MNHREQYEKETGKEALGEGKFRNHSRYFYTDEYVDWLEAKLTKKGEPCQKTIK